MSTPIPIFLIPLQIGTPQTLSIALGGVTYNLTLLYRNIMDGGWYLDIDDANGNPLVHGIALVTGANLLEQYQHLGFNGGLFVRTVGNPDAAPTFENLGDTGQLYWVPAS